LHLLSGFLVFAITLIALWLTRRVAEWIQFRIGVADAPAGTGSSTAGIAGSPVAPSQLFTRQGRLMSLLFAGLCTVSFTRLYQDLPQRSSGKLAAFPQQIGAWRMISEHSPSAKEIELLETENITSRVYRDDTGRQVALTLVYDPSGNRKMAHPQEICLRADGFDLLSSTTVAVAGTEISARRLLMIRGDNRMLYYYWYKAGLY